MFSWIIEAKAKILNISDWRFEIENIFWKSLKIGQSIAHDWACMTIEKFDDKNYTFFAMQETFDKTNFKYKKIWDYFNVERSLKIWDRIDWHFVSGHIDWVWEVEDIVIIDDKSKIIKIKYDEKFKNNLIQKGSITINWVSLTLVDTTNDSFKVSLIPLTQEITNLWLLKVWDNVNLEFDMLWKYINKIYSK